jgi:hypothetical protein
MLLATFVKGSEQPVGRVGFHPGRFVAVIETSGLKSMICLVRVEKID